MSNRKFNIPHFKDAWVLLYAAFYLIVFYYIENRTGVAYNIIFSKLDNLIPFCEYFIVPYLLWFPYMLLPLVYFYFKNKSDYNKFVIMGIIGMTTFLIISLVYPNALIIRPTSFENSNIFTTLVTYLHSIDTSTNVFPSIHVYNSLVVHVTILKSQELRNKHWVQIGSWVLCISIILSTMFLKQHSAIDVLGAFGLYTLVYPLIYGFERKTKQELLTSN